MLCLTAAGTGFRASELGSLTPEHLDLNAEPATVRCSAGYTKNRKDVVQPISSNLAESLRRYLQGKNPSESIWPGTWHKQASAKMIRLDLEETRAT